MSEGSHTKGDMDVSQHSQMWADFVTLTKWTTGVCIAVLVILAVFVA